MSYQEILRSRMKQSKVSQRQAARRSGIHYVTINRLLKESYAFKPTADTLNGLMDAIGSPRDERLRVLLLAGINAADSVTQEYIDGLRNQLHRLCSVVLGGASDRVIRKYAKAGLVFLEQEEEAT